VVRLASWPLVSPWIWVAFSAPTWVELSAETPVVESAPIWLAETGVQPNRLVAFDPAKKAFTETVTIASDGPNTIRHMTFDKATRQIWFGGDANMIGRVQVSAPPVVP